MSKERQSNFGTAVYIANTHGNNIEDEKIIDVAKKMGMYPKVLLKNYKSVTKINKIFEGINAL